MAGPHADTGTMMLLARNGMAVMVGMGALALILTLLFFASPVAAAEHGDHHGVTGQHQGHHAQPATDAPQPHGGAQSHSGNCHCISVLCVPALGTVPPVLGAVRVAQPLRHDRPTAVLARPLASVDPPPEPPRT